MTSHITAPTRLRPDVPAGSARTRLGPKTLICAHISAAGAIAVPIASGLSHLAVGAQVVLAATVVLLVSCAALLLVNALNGNHGLASWRLGPWYLAWGALVYGIASYAWTRGQQGQASIIEQRSVVTAAYAYAVATVAWTAGYLSGPPAFLTRGFERANRLLLGPTTAKLKPDPSVPWTLYLIGTAARLTLAILNGGIGYLADASSAVSSAAAYTQVLTGVSALAVFGLAVAAHQYFDRDRRGGGLPLALLLSAELATGAVLGSKEPFFVAALAVLIPYGMHRRKLPVKALASVALIFLMIVLPFNQAYRTTLRDGGRSLSMSESLAAAPGVLEKVIPPNPNTLADSYEDAIYRLRLIDSIALIVQKTPESIPYRSPGEYLYAPVIGLVPRALWPSKPIMVSGYEFGQQYYGLPPSLYTSTAPTPMGDLFRHGGLLALIIGATLFGIGVRIFDRIVRVEVDARALFFVLAFFPTIVKSEIDSIGLITAIPSMAFAAMLGVRLAASRTDPVIWRRADQSTINAALPGATANRSSISSEPCTGRSTPASSGQQKR